MVARAGVEPAAPCFRDRSPYRHRVPGNIGGPDGSRTRFLRLDRAASPRLRPRDPGRPWRNRTSDSCFGDKRDAPSPTALELLERPAGLAPASRVWKTRTLLLSYGRANFRTGGDPTAFPTDGGPPRCCYVPARLSKRARTTRSPLLARSPGNPDGDRPRQTRLRQGFGG